MSTATINPSVVPACARRTDGLMTVLMLELLYVDAAKLARH